MDTVYRRYRRYRQEIAVEVGFSRKTEKEHEKNEKGKKSYGRTGREEENPIYPPRSYYRGVPTVHDDE